MAARYSWDSQHDWLLVGSISSRHFDSQKKRRARRQGSSLRLKSLPFPYQDPERMVSVASGDLGGGFGDNVSLGDF